MVKKLCYVLFGGNIVFVLAMGRIDLLFASRHGLFCCLLLIWKRSQRQEPRCACEGARGQQDERLAEMVDKTTQLGLAGL